MLRGLQARGHQVRVLTSRYGLSGGVPPQPETDLPVSRTLPDPYNNSITNKFGLRHWAGLVAFERDSLIAWREVLREFKPDIIYCWNLAGVSYSLLMRAMRLGRPVAFYLSDEWLIHWPQRDPRQSWLESPLNSRWSQVAKPLLATVFKLPTLRAEVLPLDLRHAQFTSQFMLEKHAGAGLPTASARVIHWGVDPDRFPARSVVNVPARRILYVGQLMPIKGVHTVIEAFLHLQRSGRYPGLELTLAGGTIQPEYQMGLVAAVQAMKLEDQVHFLGKVAREKLPSIYQEHDVLVFPSVWDEPFSITLLEALSSGLAVVGTLTGGTREILVPEVNALTFPPDDAQGCAAQIARLLDDSKLAADLARAGRQTVEKHFRFTSMLDQIERALEEAVRAEQPPQA